jgi:hypothetical protein
MDQGTIAKTRDTSYRLPPADTGGERGEDGPTNVIHRRNE